MKNITRQYQDLLEGKMSQATFMVNVRRQFPDWISSTNSFKDAVTILKGKRIITEVTAKQAFQADLAKDPEHQKQIQDKLTNKNYRGGKDYLDTRTVNVATENPYINGKFEKNPKDDNEDGDLDTINAEALDYTEPTVKEAKKAIKEAEEKPVGSYKSVNGKDLLATFREIDRVNPYEFKRGIAVEMGMQYDPTPNFFTTKFNPETLDKATKKVMANLKKDPAYYTNSLDMATKEQFGMSTKAPEVSKVYDGMIMTKGLEKVTANTKTNLGNQEKRKGNPQGVKQLKEEFLREFAEPTEEKKSRFSVGHKVHTPEGVVGTIEELDHAGTATVVHEDGTKQDYQQNVLHDFGHLDGKVEKDISGKIIRATNKDGIVLTMNDKADHNGEPIEIGGFTIKGSKVLAKSKAGGEINIDDLKKVEKGPRPGVALGQDTNKMGKLKEMMKKMVDEELYTNTKTGDTESFDLNNPSDQKVKRDSQFSQLYKKA